MWRVSEKKRKIEQGQWNHSTDPGGIQEKEV
jgi:hypothetical protein